MIKLDIFLVATVGLFGQFNSIRVVNTKGIVQLLEKSATSPPSLTLLPQGIVQECMASTSNQERMAPNAANTFLLFIQLLNLS